VDEYRQRFGALNAVLVGEGSLKGEIEELCASNDIGFVGRVSDDDKFELIKRARAFILTSSYEGFGFVLIEALAGGGQVVSVDCPVGPREILNNGRGRLVDSNPVDLSLALHDCLTQRDDSLQSRLDFAEQFSARNGSESIISALRTAKQC
jgi:glycosyltransferase involved in cell wall biosynthesis